MENNNYAANKLLMKVGISPDLDGYHYLTEAINIIKEKWLNGNVNCKMMNLYFTVGKKFNTASIRVERSIRHAVERAFVIGSPLLREMFDTLLDCESGKVTNSCFIYTLAQHLIMEEGE